MTSSRAGTPGSPDQEAIPSLRQAAHQFSRLVRLIRPYWTALGQSLFLAMLLGLLGMVAPYLTKLLIDVVYPQRDVTLMHVLVAAGLGMALATTFLGGLRSYFSLYVNSRLGNATRLLFFNHLQHLEARFFERHQVGEINSRFQDVGRALESISRVFQVVFVQGIYLLLVPPILFLLEWRLALVAIITLPLSFLVTAYSGKVLRKYWKRSSEAYADLNAFQIETLSHIRTFKTMGMEHGVYRRAQGLVESALRLQLEAGGLSQFFGVVNGLLRGFNTALFTWLGWTWILGERMTLGEFLAFSAYLTFLYNPLGQLIQLFSDFQQSAVHLSRMFEYLDEPAEQAPELAYAPPPAIARPLRGEFRFEGVEFAYEPGQTVLTDLHLDLLPGTCTALVGPSGSGKTTLLRLLTALERPGQGRILVDGSDLQDLPLHELRRQISVVWQEVSLIKGSLWDNLTLGTDTPEPEEVERLISLCRLDEVLANLPEGLETEVAEWGTSLSAGQRQRVALVRALLRRSPIVLLDEATANIDVETENHILRHLFTELHERETMVLFVTHRLASAQLADRIAVLENGRLLGCDTHQVLLEHNPTYRRLHGVDKPLLSAAIPKENPS